MISTQLLAPQDVAADWSAIAEAKVLYTDNVFELSSSRRLSLSEDPSQPTIVPVKKPSDIVWEPSLDVRHTSNPTSLGPTEVSLKAHGFIFTDNPLFNHGNYRVQVKQALDSETSLLLRYRYVPNLFLGPNYERRTGQRLDEEERVTSHIWRLQLERRLTEFLIATLVGRYGLRQFNEVFAERDTTFWTSGPQLEWSLNSWFTLATAYLYERGLADGRQEVQFKDDVSYRQHFASFGATAQVSRSLSVTLGYAYRRKVFTSEIVGDSNRGVIDTTHQGSAELRYEVNQATAMTLGFQRSDNRPFITKLAIAMVSPNFFSDTDVLEPSFNSMLILSILSIPVLSGHKSGHTFSGRGRSPLSTNGVGFLCSKWSPDQQMRGGVNMAINQMVFDQRDTSLASILQT